MQFAKYLSQNAQSHESTKILTLEIFRLYSIVYNYKYVEMQIQSTNERKLVKF